MKGKELWRQAQEDLKQEDIARKAFLVSLRVLENPKTDYEKVQIAKKAIRLFFKFRAIATKSLKVRVQAANP